MGAYVMVALTGAVLGFTAGYEASDFSRAMRGTPVWRDAGTYIRNRVLTILLVLTVLVQAGVGVSLVLTRREVAKTTTEFRAYVRCIGVYNRNQADADQRRAEWSEAVQLALERLLRAVAREDAEGFRVARDDYLHYRERQREELIEHPIQTPEESCGKPPAR